MRQAKLHGPARGDALLELDHLEATLALGLFLGRRCGRLRFGFTGFHGKSPFREKAGR
jgi:hypothetical protein